MPKTLIAFDLYGTLLSTESISNELAKHFGQEKAEMIATLARRYQLEYTWRSNSMGLYRPFDILTRHSFRQATTECTGEILSPQIEDDLINAYNGLDTFPDVPQCLSLLTTYANILDPWIFSNGTKHMISSSLLTSPTLSPSSSLEVATVLNVNKVVSVDAEELKVYKPDERTYNHMMRVGRSVAGGGNAWLVSSNPFDVLGALAAGMKTAWVNRGGLGWDDGLAGALGMRPTVIVKGVDEAVVEIAKRVGHD